MIKRYEILKDGVVLNRIVMDESFAYPLKTGESLKEITSVDKPGIENEKSDPIKEIITRLDAIDSKITTIENKVK